MQVAIGSDHRGFDLKTVLASRLSDLGHGVEDLGPANGDVSVDYPDYGAAVGRAVAAGRGDLGLCVCATGIGISIAANKVPGIRAAVVHDVTTARLAREHNHANVLCLGAEATPRRVALAALEAFLAAVPQPGRHERRVAEITALEGPLGAGRGGQPVTTGGPL